MAEHTFTPLGPVAIFNALGDPTRLHIFEYLCHEELTAEDLSLLTNIGYKGIYKQLKILEKVGLIESYLDSKYRYYYALSSNLEAINAWISVYEEFIHNLDA